MYSEYIGKKVEDIPKTIDGKEVEIHLSSDKQLKNYNTTLIIRVNEVDNKVIMLSSCFMI